MAELFDELVDATIGHLQRLKEQGVRYVTVTPESLDALASRNSPPTAPALATAKRRAATPPSPRPTPRAEAEATMAHSTAGPLTNEAKAQAMAELRDRAMQCVKCPNLASSRKNVVFG